MSTRGVRRLLSRSAFAEAAAALRAFFFAGRCIRAWRWPEAAQAGTTQVYIMGNSSLSENAEMLGDERLVVANVGDAAGEGHAPRVQDHDVVGEVEREL